jgi:hypothetical protein
MLRTLQDSRAIAGSSAMPSAVIAVESIQRSIHSLRGLRVMLDVDLARLYGVPTKRLNEAVKRNLRRFPADFMFEMTAEEVDSLRSQSATSKGRGGRRYLPRVFTEQGVAMLSSVLNSERAIAVNIEIMRAFVQMRKVLAANVDLAKRLAILEAEMGKHAAEFGHHRAETVRALKIVFDTLKALAAEGPEPEHKPVGFKLK